MTTGIHASRRVGARGDPATGHSFRGRPEPVPHTQKDLQRQLPPKVLTVQQALIHHTAGHCRIWKGLRRGSQVSKEPQSPIRRYFPGSHLREAGPYQDREGEGRVCRR
ncbi:predicted protein [Streptomyces viridosporus ATCC 14672]|uniref:Predicted protein n=1 Tax=Streptomyces viridosporus (strain ATCC 14672 / DSM 40746 / JCM 4963 / KCTC 9882 / NRRL B-12104 / FH 1290) TaxID=566461 RepID=D5ZXX0_STRV1|nr:predicted protein [Streptomyces viridosporus ATCC 14672]